MSGQGPTSEQIHRNAFLDTLIKIGASVCLPLLIAGILLYTTVNVEQARNQEQQKQIEGQQKQIEKLNTNDKEVGKEIGELKVTIGQMEVKLDVANEKLTEIRTLVLEGKGN